MPVIKLLGQVYRGTCDKVGCDWRVGGHKARVEQAIGWHEAQHMLQIVVDGICEDVGYDPHGRVRLQVWPTLQVQHKGYLGMAWYAERIIAIEAKWLGSERLEDTIRHEVAHFLAYDEHGCADHGYWWVQACLRVGAVPKARKELTAAEVAMVHPRRSGRARK